VPNAYVALIPFKPKVGDTKARGVVADDILDIFREAVDGVSCYIEHQCDRRTPRSVQLAQYRLGDVADLRCRTVRIERDLGVETPRAAFSPSRRRASENWEGCSPGIAQASRRRATSIPLLVDPWGEVAMNSAVAARVTRDEETLATGVRVRFFCIDLFLRQK
jgi:hypothetical protein